MPTSQRAGIKRPANILLGDSFPDLIIMKNKVHFKDAGYTGRFIAEWPIRDFVHLPHSFCRRVWYHPNTEEQYIIVSNIAIPFNAWESLGIREG